MNEESKSALSAEKKITIQRFITLGELTASTSHELKNLLLSINGYCEMILEKARQNEPVEEELLEMKRSAELAKSIFMELLDTSKTGGKVKASLNQLIKSILIILQTNKSAQFKQNLDQSIPEIDINPQKIKQVLINIIMNAIDALEEGLGEITITTGPLPLSFGSYIKIKDNGCGMSENVKKSLFQPFFTTKSKGTGLGLSVCMDIMKDHNGTIHVESEQGKGTTFTLLFLLPAIKPHPHIIDL